MEETTIHLSSCYITGQWGRVQNKIKETEPKTLTQFLTFYYLLLFLIIKLCLYHDFHDLYQFYGLFTAYLLQEEVMSVRLYGLQQFSWLCKQ